MPSEAWSLPHKSKRSRGRAVMLGRQAELIATLGSRQARRSPHAVRWCWGPRRSALDNWLPKRQTGAAGDGRADAEVDVYADRGEQEYQPPAGLQPGARGVDRPDQH